MGYNYFYMEIDSSSEHEAKHIILKTLQILHCLNALISFEIRHS